MTQLKDFFGTPRFSEIARDVLRGSFFFFGNFICRFILFRDPFKVVHSLTCSTRRTFTSQTMSADVLLRINPLRVRVKTSTRCSEEVPCSALYPVIGEDEDGDGARLKP